ncbi:multidrug effflux MFS transporter [Jannaschia sp. 2305UL9-9]|uniref:multidrug effflux MFS transporter n=1 Tax=Jannaschia sp. 2305UL9-9 TaxID=3121638 RepID=UPI003526E2CE
MIAPTRRLSQVEFVALMAMLTATIAFSIDSMLPALPEIGATLSPDAPNAAQLVIVSFVFGMGVGTLFMGPLSDAFGRKPVMLGGLAIYATGAIIAVYAPTLETVLAARILQGFGASAPRVASQAMIRDLYAGRGMARVSSFVMMTFALVPAVAPLIGSGIITGFGWHGIFWAFVVFASLSGSWLMLRQPETLPDARRRSLDLGRLRGAAVEVLSHGNVRRAILVQTLVYGMLFATIASVQPVYDVTFGMGSSFPYWFGLVAVLAAGASFVNARLVGRLGMVVLLRRALGAFLVLSVVLGIAWVADLLPEALRFPAFFVWQVGSFGLAGMTIGNVQAIAMQPLGHIAGMAASVISAVATIAAVVVATPIGLAFDGTPVPLVAGVGICTAIALFLARRLEEEPAALSVQPVT